MIRRPVMRYHGGKWKLAPWIIQHFPEHRVYVEAFGGAGSVLMQKPRAYAEVINDLDGEIVNVFRVLRNPTTARELERIVRLTPFAREEFELSYLADGDPVEQSRRTIFRTFAGFGSSAFNTERPTGFRHNTTRSGTTPAHDWADYPSQIALFCERLRGVVVENRNAADVLLAHDAPTTLHYVDPPYVQSTRQERQRRNYGDYEMTDDEHRELAAVLHGLQGMVVLSGYPCALYDELYVDWHKEERGAFADGAIARVEALWMSPNAVVQPTLMQRARVTADAPLFARVAE